VIFPSWLYHTVSPYDGDVPRISLAFNITLKKVTDQEGAEIKVSA
jgi:hypothetical protein